MNDELIKEKLEELIKEGELISSNISKICSDNEKLKNLNSTRELLDAENNRKLSKFYSSVENILQIRFGESSIYYTMFKNAGNNVSFFVKKENCIPSQIGVLETILEALELGLTDDLFFQRELLVFSDLLDQAFEFFENDLLLAAGIHGRIVLETTVKEFATEKGIDSEKNFDKTIINLRKAGIINQPFEISLRGNYKIGSWAAHGNKEFNDLSKSEIHEFLIFIRDKVLTLQ